MKNKKLIIFLIIALVIVIAAVSCIVGYRISVEDRTRTITDFYDNNPENIESISIMSGNNGNTVYIQEEDYKDVTEFLSKLSFPGVCRGKPRDGFPYSIKIQQKGGNTISITFQGDRCSINRKEYNLENYENAFMKSLFLKYYEEPKKN